MYSEPCIYIIDDDEAICDSTKFLLESVSLNVKAFRNPIEFLAHITAQFQNLTVYHPGCIILDVRMPVMGGPTVQAQLQELNIPLPIIFLTAYKDITLAVKAIKQGAFDFICKPIDAQQLIEIIQNAIKLSIENIQKLKKAENIIVKYNSLTNREKEVLNHLCNGERNKAISAKLHISIKTVEMHRSNILRKMGDASLIKISLEVQTYINERERV